MQGLHAFTKEQCKSRNQQKSQISAYTNKDMAYATAAAPVTFKQVVLM
jgi:hypothetical protein